MVHYVPPLDPINAFENNFGRYNLKIQSGSGEVRPLARS